MQKREREDDDNDAREDGRIGIEGDAGGSDGNYGESSTIGPYGLDLEIGARGACGDSGDVLKVERDVAKS